MLVMTSHIQTYSQLCDKVILDDKTINNTIGDKTRCKIKTLGNIVKWCCDCLRIVPYM